MRILPVIVIIAVIFVAGCSGPQQPPADGNTDNSNAADFQCSGRTLSAVTGDYIPYLFGSSDGVLFVTEPVAFLAGAGVGISSQGADLGTFAKYSDKIIIKDGKVYYTSNEPCWPKGKGIQGNFDNLLYEPGLTEEQLQLRADEYDKLTCVCVWVSDDMCYDKA